MTELLTPSGRSTTRPLVEVVGDDNGGAFSALSKSDEESALADDKEDENDDDSNQFLHEQRLQNENGFMNSNGKYAYGFAQKTMDAVEKLQVHLRDCLCPSWMRVIVPFSGRDANDNGHTTAIDTCV